MGLFKSKDERRVEREMKIRQGVRAIERSIRQQEKFAEDFIKNAQNARKIGDNNQYLFVRNALKKTGRPPEVVIEEPAEMHGYYDETANLNLYTKMLAFFDKYIGPAAHAASAGK